MRRGVGCLQGLVQGCTGPSVAGPLPPSGLRGPGWPGMR